MIWVLVILVVIVIYNAERIPDLMAKFRNEVPHIVETGKKVSKEIKDKAQAVAEKNKNKSKK